MTLADAVAAFESRFTAVEETTIYRHELVEIVSGGLKNEGESSPCYCVDEATAVRLWLEAAVIYATAVGGARLVWRTMPELVGMELAAIDPFAGGWKPFKVYKVYSRFAILGAPSKVDYMAAVRGAAGR